MGLSVQTVAATHAPDHGRGDAFGIRHRFVGRHVVGQIVFVDAPEGSQECTQAGALWGAETRLRAVSRRFVPSLDALHALADRPPPHPPARLPERWQRKQGSGDPGPSASASGAAAQDRPSQIHRR